MKPIKIMTILFVLLSLSACTATVIEDGDAMPTVFFPTTTAVPPNTVTPIVEETVTPIVVETAVPTNTAAPPPATPPTPTIPPTPIVAQPTDVKAIAAHADLNLRNGPGTEYAVIGWLSNGQVATVSGISSDGGWWQLSCPGNVAATICWVTAAPIYTLPVNAEPVRVQFDPGAVSKTITGDLPVGAQVNYLLAAQAGQRMQIEISSLNNVANFSLVGMSDGQPYKRLENEDRHWEGILPQSQDYGLRVSTLANAEFTLIVTIEHVADEIVWPFVHAPTGWLLGSSSNGGWLDTFETRPFLLAGERTYNLYDIGGWIGQVTGSVPQIPDGPCNQPTMILSPLDGLGRIAIIAPWEAAPRTPEMLATDTAVYQEAIAALLQEQGIAEPDVQITGVARIDLEGDGVDEVFITASRLSFGLNLPAAEAGDYSLVVLRKVINDQAVTIPMALSLSLTAEDFAHLLQFPMPMLLDLNGDGKLEIIIDSLGYESRAVTVYEATQNGAQSVLGMGCRL